MNVLHRQRLTTKMKILSSWKQASSSQQQLQQPLMMPIWISTITILILCFRPTRLYLILLVDALASVCSAPPPIGAPSTTPPTNPSAYSVVNPPPSSNPSIIIIPTFFPPLRPDGHSAHYPCVVWGCSMNWDCRRSWLLRPLCFVRSHRVVGCWMGGWRGFITSWLTISKTNIEVNTKQKHHHCRTIHIIVQQHQVEDRDREAETEAEVLTAPPRLRFNRDLSVLRIRKWKWIDTIFI